MVDNGEFISFVIYSDVPQDFLLEVFNCATFDDLVSSGIESLDDTNTNELNVRLLNIINQLRAENHGLVQPIKFLFLE